MGRTNHAIIVFQGTYVPRYVYYRSSEGQFRTQSPEQVDLQDWQHTDAERGRTGRQRTPRTVRDLSRATFFFASSSWVEWAEYLSISHPRPYPTLLTETSIMLSAWGAAAPNADAAEIMRSGVVTLV
ncbi:hypothetical protein HPB52_024565 [Rhipicephalus sanguineus]|uniref:Uncharacterized protein n=1 Tax=Rhipicephalus sanguineus TaxID=34632 RepID=A0A9D4SN35_RHISA|nr:hypothetical protein HPB52_024565 [Rhipicephalus sanguineus]